MEKGEFSAYLHTDLVLELQEELELQGAAASQSNASAGNEGKQEECNNHSFGDGIQITKREMADSGLREITITIKNAEGERLLGKPKGVYITLEGVNLAENDGEYHEEMSRLFAENLMKLLGKKRKILFAGLGNREVTPDALGPLVIENLFITGHLMGQAGEADVSSSLSSLFSRRKMCASMAVAPGVMAQTGMETGDILRGIIDRVRPEALVVIDALAAKSSERLTRTIQLGNTGIAPGAGVGNERKEISLKTMGIPVIAIGVPTVISVPAMAGEILSAVASFAEPCGMASPTPPSPAKDEGSDSAQEDKKKRKGDFASWTERERYAYLAKRLPQELFRLVVTPKEMDESVRRISFTISEGINQVIANAVDGGDFGHIFCGQA